ncbi:MAG: hypothetical protein Q8L14_43250 [Myxococcales bacterium]|nr:hypothetical protein [Myxococcales bacterium]
MRKLLSRSAISTDLVVSRLVAALIVLAPLGAWANSIVPANDLGALANAYLFPLVIVIEWLVYRAHRLDHALRGAVVLNLVTSAMGFTLMFVSEGIATFGYRSGGVVGQALVFPLLHFSLTVATEQGLNRVLNRSKPWPFAAVLRANAATYAPIMLLNALLLRS